MKAHIIPIVYQLSDTNYNVVASDVTSEIDKYTTVSAPKKKISTCPMCFDTETTTINTTGNERYAFVYCYQLQVGNITVIARKRDLILKLFKEIHYHARYINAFLYCGIANIKYEWSFLRVDLMKLFESDPGSSTEVSILLDTCQPLMVNMGNIMLVDICNMTNSSLAKIGEDYCTTQKCKGDLDYDIIRNSITPLTPEEMQYCINDVVVGAEYMAYMHDTYTKNHKKMPTTATSIPRSIMASEAYRTSRGKKVYKKVLDKIIEGTPLMYPEYDTMMNYLFRGGYTHGNLYYAGAILNDVEHVDYTSDYPACLLQYKYPTLFRTDYISYHNKYLYCNKYSNEDGLNDLMRYENDLAFYCTVVFHNITAVTDHTIESEHKCMVLSDDAVIDNGRIKSASEIKVMITEQDYKTYTKFYSWTSMDVSDLHIGKKEPLPDYVIMAITESYVMKKWLKDNNMPYASEKAILNSCYGCTVQRFNIEDKKEVYINNTVSTITCPFPFRYLDLSEGDNSKHFNRICENISNKYGYPNNAKLQSDVMAIYKAFGDGYRRFDNDYANNIAAVVVEVLQQAAYDSERYGTYGRSKMLSPYWGIWCTAYARRRLTDMIYKLESWAISNDYQPIVVYCDTDSMFMASNQDVECHEYVTKCIKEYNDHTKDYNIANLTKYTRFVTDTSVTNKAELLNDIGMFDYEPTASHFKQLGAKRYLQRYIPKKKTEYIIESTVAGLNKKDFSDKINSIEGSIEDKFTFFSSGMTFEEFETSKLRPVYHNSPYEATVTDEYGNTEVMRESCGQVLLHVGFEMTLKGLIEKYARSRIG